MYQESTKSKHLLVNLRHGILLCAVLTLLGCAQLSNSSPRDEGRTTNSPTLKERLATGDYAAVILVDKNQQTSVYAAGGLDVTNSHCGEVTKDGDIVDNEKLPKEQQCNLQGVDLLNLQNIQLYTIRQNPNCTVIRRGPYLVKVHAGGDGYPPGAFPCHAGAH